MTLPLIPTAVVGSHGKPSWWFAGVKAYERGEFGPADLEEMFDDAADTAIRDMERAGIDTITDGEVRRLDGYVDSYYAIIKGIEPIPVRRRAGPWPRAPSSSRSTSPRAATSPGRRWRACSTWPRTASPRSSASTSASATGSDARASSGRTSRTSPES